jgi:hypothetical protein
MEKVTRLSKDQTHNLERLRRETAEELERLRVFSVS